MKKLVPLLLPLAAILITGCVSQPPQLSREDQLKLQEEKRQYFEKYMTRTYSGVSQQQLLEAGQKLFTLSDGDDVRFQHMPDGFIANRNWHWYAVLAADRGVDRWTYKITETSLGIFKVAVTENTISYMHNQQSTYVYGVGVVNVGTPTTTEIQRYNENNALYAIFWRRLDYLLGKSKAWQTCEAFEAELKTSTELTGNIKPLCGPLAKDELPEALRPAA